MVATSPSGSPLSWRPTTRTLGAVFTGSAVMLAAAVVQGGSPVTPSDETAPTAESLSGGIDTEQTITSGNADTTALVSTGQTAAWAPGTSPDWTTPLREQPIRRAPVQTTPQRTAPPQTGLATDGTEQGQPDSADDPFRDSDQPDDQSDGGVLNRVLIYFTPGSGA